MNRHERRAAAAQEPKWRREQVHEVMRTMPGRAKFSDSYEQMIALYQERGFVGLVGAMVAAELGRRPQVEDMREHIVALAGTRLVNVHGVMVNPADAHSVMLRAREHLAQREPSAATEEVLSEAVYEEVMRLAEEQLMGSIESLRAAVSS